MRAYRTWGILAASLALGLRPAPAAGQGTAKAALDGNWVRVESNNLRNDQMRVRLSERRAVLTRVPQGVRAAFRVGVALWTNIQPDGAVHVLGSDGKYHPGHLELKGDELVLSIDKVARGNDQTWRRAGPTLDGEWVRIAPDDPSADGIKVLAEHDQASVRFLPAGAPRVLRIGSRLWRDVGAGGTLQVLEGTGKYRPATLRLEGDDRLWVEGGGTAPELWVRPDAVDLVRGEMSGPTAGEPETSLACVGSRLPEPTTGVTWDWGLTMPDRQTTAAERLGILDYRGEAPPRDVVTDVERTTFPGLDPGFSYVWQQGRGRDNSVVHTDLTAADFASRNRTYRAAGRMLTDIEVYATPRGLRYAGVWTNNPDGVDWEASHGLTSAAFGERFEAQRAAGFRLTDIEAYDTEGGLRYAAIWQRSCDNDTWREVRGLTREDYQRRVDSMSSLGFKVVDFESSRTSGGQRYAAIWERVSGRAWAVHSDRTLTGFLNYHHRYTDQGFRLIDFESYETDAGTRYAGIWAENDPRYRLPFRATLDDTVAAYRRTHRLAGISVTIIRNGEPIYQRGLGWADSARSKEAFSATVYPTASVAKVFAGTIAARLEARGVIDLTRPTRDYVDSLSAGHTHTLEQLLSKTGCVVHYTEGPEPPERYYRWRRDVLAAVDTTKLSSWLLSNCTPGTVYRYSTHGFTLVGAALEKALGKDIVQIVEEEIAGPMALGSLRDQVPGNTTGNAVRAYLQAEPYSMDTTTRRIVPSVLALHEDASWKVLGGGLQIDAPDLARFGWFVLNGWAVSDSVRDNRLWRVLTTGLPNWNPQFTTPPTALAWEVRRVDRRRVAEHGGTATGARSFLAVYRDDGLVVAILTNQRQAPGTMNHPIDDLAHSLARIALAP